MSRLPDWIFSLACIGFLFGADAVSSRAKSEEVDRFSLEVGETQLTGLATRSGEDALEIRLVAKWGGNCYSSLGEPDGEPSSEWIALCESLQKDGTGVFTGTLQRDPWSAVSAFTGELKREDTGFSREFTLTPGKGCYTDLGIGLPSSQMAFHKLTSCKRQPTSATSAAYEHPTASGASFPVLLVREGHRFEGFATPYGAGRMELDMKFAADDAVVCTRAFDAENDAYKQGWQRMCQSAARFGELRLAGMLEVTGGGVVKVLEGELTGRDPAFAVDVKIQSSKDCVLRIATRGSGNLYSYFETECSPSGEGQLPSASEATEAEAGDDAELVDAINNWFQASEPSDAQAGSNSSPEADGRAPLAPGGLKDRANNLGPVDGADDDLFPVAGAGYLKLFFFNVEEGAPGGGNSSEPWARIQLARVAPGQEEIRIDSYSQCPNDVKIAAPAFCKMAEENIGEAIAIEDYGFNGSYGIGRFTYNGDTWFLRLRGDTGKLEADLIRTQLMVQSDLGVNPTAQDAKSEYDVGGRQLPVASEDLYPLDGYGHMQVFIAEKMPISTGRPNVLVQSGDVVFRGSGSNARIHIDDYGQCPTGVSRRFCNETQSGLNRSWPVEDYRFNGAIGTGEVSYAGTRYVVVLAQSSSGQIEAQFYLSDRATLGMFSTKVGPYEEQPDDHAEAGAPACATGFQGQALVVFARPKNHKDEPLAWCSGRACVDQDIGYAHTMCEVAYREDLRRSGELTSGSAETQILWGKACGIQGSPQNAAAFKAKGAQSGIFVDAPARVMQAYRHLNEGQSLDFWLDYESCSNCQAIEALACEKFEG
ncbi:hypothetical protein [Roseibium aggregatum]|uniref:Uncharacterized protein n=1 Tax=Roseibium aggregatum TaxID=187304 RepID=A0A939J1H4_9HYPH|nr:hypothetical protein [Roseibium aggregatum]MBN9672146.1 hypothetical protein [Roseibium aggregatum]